MIMEDSDPLDNCRNPDNESLTVSFIKMEKRKIRSSV